MKTVTISLDGRANFHNMPDINLQVADDAVTEDGGMFRVQLSESQTNRIGRHYCPSRRQGCTCGCGNIFDFDGSIRVDEDAIESWEEGFPTRDEAIFSARRQRVVDPENSVHQLPNGRWIIG